MTVYANNAEIKHSPWDFRIGLGQVAKADENEMVIEEVATVYMSPAHTKAFLKALANNLERFEKTFGVIEDPQEKIGAKASKQ